MNDIDNEDTLNEVSNFVKKLTGKKPCQYSIEEVREGLNEAFEEYEKGELIPHEEIKRRFT